MSKNIQKTTRLNVALVHDYLKEYGGAERVLEALHELYPDAPVFTSVYLPQFLGPHRERFANWDIHTSWLQYVPFNQKLISPFRLLSPLIFRHVDLSAFDIVIVSATGAYFPNMIRTKLRVQSREQRGEASARSRMPIHICYCHTPPRYLYGYATAREWKKHKFFLFLGTIVNHFLRMVDLEASQNVDYYVANSEEVALRIKKFYRRDASVIYPPVERGGSVQEVAHGRKENHEPRATSYYLTGGRLARAKHIDLIIQACLERGIPLKVFGKGFAGYEEALKKSIKGDEAKALGTSGSVEFLGEVTDEEKFALMRDAKAFLFASEDEDFGITPVEAMSVGTPVIAHRSGGVRETVINGKTGVFFDELHVESLMQALLKFEKIKIDPKVCIKQAEKFSKERFRKEIQDFVNSKFKM